MKKVSPTNKFLKLYTLLQETGWSESISDTVRCFKKNFGSQVLVLNLSESLTLDGEVLSADWFLHSNRLFEISQLIMPNKHRVWLPLSAVVEAPDKQQAVFRLKHAEAFSFSDADCLVEKVTHWMQAVDVENKILSIAKSPIPSVGGGQLKHLAALAYVGDFCTLMDYKEAFARGERLNFVPMIKPAMIDKALDVALEAD